MTKKKTNKDKVWAVEVNGLSSGGTDGTPWKMVFSDKEAALAFLGLIDDHGISCGNYSNLEPIHSVRAGSVSRKRLEWEALSYDEQKKLGNSYARFRDGRPLSADEADEAATQ